MKVHVQTSRCLFMVRPSAVQPLRARNLLAGGKTRLAYHSISPRAAPTVTPAAVVTAPPKESVILDKQLGALGQDLVQHAEVLARRTRLKSVYIYSHISDACTAPCVSLDNCLCSMQSSHDRTVCHKVCSHLFCRHKGLEWRKSQEMLTAGISNCTGVWTSGETISPRFQARKALEQSTSML